MFLTTLLAVFIGGGIGSTLRWLISLKLNDITPNVPVGTLTVNLIGAFIIGLALALFNRMAHLDPLWKMLITTGFCGGLTTFSTFSLEVVYLIQDSRFLWAALTVLFNLAGSLAMTMLAFMLVNMWTAQ